VVALKLEYDGDYRIPDGGLRSVATRSFLLGLRRAQARSFIHRVRIVTLEAARPLS
jgi:hypothetical protein